MSDSEYLIDGQVITYWGGRKDTDTATWRDATDLELKQQAEIDSLTAELEQVKIITAEMDCTDWCGKSSKYDSAGELKFDSRCPKCKLTEIVQLVGSKE